MLEKEKIINALTPIAKSKKGDALAVSFSRYHHCVSKFANSRITQNLEDDDITIYIKVIDSGRTGVASTNSLGKNELQRTLEGAASIARFSPKTPQKAVLPKLKDIKIKEIKTYFPYTADFAINNRRALMQEIFKNIKSAGFEPSGTILTGTEEMAVLGSDGKFLYQPFSIASLKLIAQKDAQVGFASALSRDITSFDLRNLTSFACEKAKLNNRQKEIEPGKYDCILEPEAVAEIIDWLGYIGFGAKSFAEHTSFLSGRIEQKIMQDNITIYDDGLDENGLAMPFDFEGMPRQKVTLIERGIAKGLVYDTEYGSIYKKPSTGHALTPDSTDGPLPMNLAMAAGDATLDEMISSLKKGILISRFHYVNGFLNPREALMTGLTRDGTFLIRQGKIKCALGNLRFTESILGALNRAAMISKERKLIGDPNSDVGATLVPAILVRDFTFT
ncbi:MAG: TldD/PmbA family protein, partial [Candidatus Omnitrophota bacterium]